jgi:hypothetical protein
MTVGATVVLSSSIMLAVVDYRCVTKRSDFVVSAAPTPVIHTSCRLSSGFDDAFPEGAGPALLADGSYRAAACHSVR